MRLRTCVDPEGHFMVGIHQPGFVVDNFRENTIVESLGKLSSGQDIDNRGNFPDSQVSEPSADTIYEITNPFGFRGTSFINTAWAEKHAGNPESVKIPCAQPCSFTDSLDSNLPESEKISFLASLPRPLKLALAQVSTDPKDLVALAKQSCAMIFDPATGSPTGMEFIPVQDKNPTQAKPVPKIHDHELFEILVNNPYLPDSYKNVLVLRPGIQGSSEIVGEYASENTSSHVFEYLRRNSYIPWGHFASNMANDAVRYRAGDLTSADMTGLRHLYYQRIYARMARALQMEVPQGKCMACDTLESFRVAILDRLQDPSCPAPFFDASLWGWNFGFGSSQSGHRLHASHQMIHQQNAMIPASIVDEQGKDYLPFSCGDLITEFIDEFYRTHKIPFFQAYLSAIRSNVRTDGRGHDLANSLIVHEDSCVILFVPKAQVSEWQLCLMTKTPCPNILFADTAMRTSLDQGILRAVQILEALGANMVTAIEWSGRMGAAVHAQQHLMYDFIPRLPYAPPTFSEAQMRSIIGCYPEDFALACRNALSI